MSDVEKMMPSEIKYTCLRFFVAVVSLVIPCADLNVSAKDGSTATISDHSQPSLKELSQSMRKKPGSDKHGDVEVLQQSLSPDVTQAQIYLNNGDYRAAIQKATAAVALNPKDGQAYLCRGIALSLIDKTHAAISDLELGFKLSPVEIPVAYMQAADCYAVLNQFDKALVVIDKYIKLKPTFVAYREKGQILSNLGRNQDALICFSKSIELNPKFHWTYDDRARSYIQLGRLKDALNDANTIVKLNPSDARGYITRAKIYDKLGDKISAAKDLHTSQVLAQNEFN